MNQGDISGILEVAIVSARLAGQRALEQQRYVKSSVKNDTELVSDADVLCQKMIIDRIKQSFPDHGFIGEEGENGNILLQKPRGGDDIWWVIDPIDGTNNFVAGMMTFSVSVGVVFEGMPLAAAIFEPATESMFTTARNCDSQLNLSRITVSDNKLGKYSNFALDANMAKTEVEKITRVMEVSRFRNLGSTALHMAYVAKGGLVGMITNTPRIWDIAAGTLLVENAGGKVTDRRGEKIWPVDLAKYDGRKFDIIASNNLVHKELMEIFKD